MRRLLLAILVVVPLSARAADSFPTGRLLFQDRSHLYVASLKNGKVVGKKAIWSFGGEYSVIPSPDGRQVAFSYLGPASMAYKIGDIRTRQTRVLKGIPEFSGMRWAPDSRHLVTVHQGVYSLLDTRTDTRVNIPGKYARADWFPDGKTLLLTKAEKGNLSFWAFDGTIRMAESQEVDRQMGPCFRVALKAALVPNWTDDAPWEGLEFSPSRRLAIYTLIDPRENSFTDDGNVPTMASYLHLPMFTILRDAKAQRSKIDVGERNGFIPLAWSKDERTVIGRLYDNHGQFAMIRDGKLSATDLGVQGAVPVAFYSN